MFLTGSTSRMRVLCPLVLLLGVASGCSGGNDGVADDGSASGGTSSGGSNLTGGETSTGGEADSGGSDTGSGGSTPGAGGVPGGTGGDGDSGGAQSGGRTASGGSAAKGAYIGEPCTQDDDCDPIGYATCKTDWEGGYCTRSCESGSDCDFRGDCGGPDGSQSFAPGEGMCLKLCGNCRPGYSCIDVVCVPTPPMIAEFTVSIRAVRGAHGAGW